MSVVFLADARAKRRSPPSNRWAFNEVAELARLYRAKYERGGADGFAHGTTDFGDPQFYVLSDDSDQSCKAYVSRLTKNGRSLYVVEDGKGRIEREGDCLRTLVAQTLRELHGRQ